jgi:broad specificity phosphatase PhoE
MSDLGDYYGFVVRHGDTAANEQGLARGISAVPLSSLGIKQAYEDGKALTGQNVTSLRVSALERAKHHGKIISKIINIPPAFTKRLDTLDIGSLTNQLDSKVKETVAKLSADEPNKRFPNGQSFNEWAKFIWPEIHYFFLLIKAGQHPVIVTHGRLTNLIEALISGECKYLDRDTLRHPPKQLNGEIFVVLYDGKNWKYEAFFTPPEQFSRQSKKGSI